MLACVEMKEVKAQIPEFICPSVSGPSKWHAC
jgi:hypothetical protein